MRHFSLGLDYGTESARALLLDLQTGEEAAVVIHPYRRHGVLSRALPSGRPLPPLWALQHLTDYLEVIHSLLNRMQIEARRLGGAIMGIGIDFTASTVLPTKADGTPPALLDAFQDHPHAYVKLWKHHTAEPYVQAINQAQPFFVKYYGGKTSVEWSLARPGRYWRKLRKSGKRRIAGSRLEISSCGSWWKRKYGRFARLGIRPIGSQSGMAIPAVKPSSDCGRPCLGSPLHP